MNEVIEMCLSCMREVDMFWNIEADGYKAFCPYCGERLMLCDECMHSENGEFKGNCDYDTESGTCKYNKGREENV